MVPISVDRSDRLAPAHRPCICISDRPLLENLKVSLYGLQSLTCKTLIDFKSIEDIQLQNVTGRGIIIISNFHTQIKGMVQS